MGGVYLLNDKKNILTLEAAFGLSQEFFDAIETVAVGDKIVGKVAVEGKTIVINELDSQNSFKGNLYIKEGITCAAYIPLLAKKKVIGVIVVGTRTHNNLTQEEVNILESLSNYFALALQRLKMMERLAQLATIDALTGLYNRRAFFEEMETYIARINRHGGKVAILMIDIDFFKQYNDTNGHLQGDKMLKKVAQIIQKSIRAGDIAARYGGEEFVILAHAADKQEAVILAERLRESVYKKHHKEKVSFSIGISSYPIHGKDADTLLKRADEALFEAKRSGRNCVKVFQN
jgi:diguanylate cyclase (GGDEF)-like protein